MSILSVWKAHPEAIIHIPWITCLGYNAIELSRVCLMRSFWKLVLRFKCSRSKSTQMVSSLLYFNLWRCLVRACTNATEKTKRVTFWHAPCSEALEFSFISSGSEWKWFRDGPTLAHKSSFWARSATVSAKRDRTSAEHVERASAKRERAKARLVSLAANHIKWRHFRANFSWCCMQRCLSNCQNTFRTSRNRSMVR